LGIGLTLVKRLVEMHDGCVTVRSEGPGCGSEFRVRLPILVPTPPGRHAEPRKAGPAATRRILIVDDNEDSATALATLLRMSGHETVTAHDGLAAVAAAENYRPDVLLLDISLPKVDGHEAARRIRRQPWGKEMLLVALTGWGQDEDRRRSKEAGFDEHLVKPVDYQALQKLLGSV
jgi:CheY-like chemotaxis protein